MLKKVYIEITNSCNLNCPFCIKTTEAKRFLSFDEFKIILGKLKGFTKYLYFHILGEPFMHPLINEFIDYASKEGFFVNITTNGYLLSCLKTSNVRQINISLQSIMEKTDLNNYMLELFKVTDNLPNTIISYRMWINNPLKDDILKLINKHYHASAADFNNVKLKDRVFLSSFHEFIWPDLNNDYYCEKGSCYALKDHIGILSNGKVVPCCLDTKGDIDLGNIFEDDIKDILNGERAQKMLKGFQNKQKCEELCKHCSFLD